MFHSEPPQISRKIILRPRRLAIDTPEENHMAQTAPVLVEGICHPDFAAVQQEFERNFRERGEVGAAVCVYRDGKPVVDLWGGHKDLARTLPWERDTIVIMNSVAKSM